MSSLLHDRYLVVNPTHACDLATGEVVTIDGLAEPRRAGGPVIPALGEVLDHGRDGQPRCVCVDAAGMRWKTAVDRVAVHATERGYVPIGVELYSRLLPAFADEIASRSLVLISSSREAVLARRALVDCAVRTPRPHVLLVLTSGSEGTPHVREARAAYQSPRRRIVAPIPPDVLQQMQRARRAPEFIAAGRHAAAERLLRDVGASLVRRAAWPQAAGVALDLGRLLLERGRPAEAARVFAEAAAIAKTASDDDLETRARLWLATADIDARQLTAAEAICRALLAAGGLSRGLHAWTHAVLVRVLLWQERLPEALDVPGCPEDADEDLDVETCAFIRSTAVRTKLAAGQIFEAGVLAQHLTAATAGAAPVARVIGLTARLRVLAAAGELLAAESCLLEIAGAARAARAPLRMLRARIVWLDTLRRAGLMREAEREVRRVARLAGAAPPLLRAAVEARAVTADRVPGRVLPLPGHTAAAGLVRIAQEEEDDRAALTRVLDACLGELRATRIDCWSADGGPPTAVLSVGTGLPTTIGPRVLEAGLRIGPDGADPPPQLGIPVRIGSRLLGGLVARWPADRVPPPDSHRLLDLAAAVVAARLDAMLYRARLDADAATLIPELIGVSRGIADVRQMVARAAAAPFAVLVEGESGVGKELIARAVHYLSPRRERRFCDVNCAALPDDLLESELFGHAKGAFTGAVVDRAGLFEEAHGGTLFLDEVADLSPRAQAKLLRVVQQHEIRRVGETFARPVDVRLVAAANRDMRAEAEAGRFRQDLLYRLDVVRIKVPALRDRPEDIPILARHFWCTAADRVGTVSILSPGVISALAAYHWPGNVRELQNVVAALAVAAPRRGKVLPDLLPAAISGATPIRTPRLADARDQFERRFVEVTLARTGGNRARAARALGISRQGLLKLMARLGVNPQP